MKKKIFALVLAVCMVLTMMPAVAFANTETVGTLQGLTLHGGGFWATPNNDGTVGNGIFTQTMTVKYDGVIISDYTVRVGAEFGEINRDNENGTFTFIPKKAGICEVKITYKDQIYAFKFYVDENDLPYTRYHYNLQDGDTMLPHNGRSFGSTLRGEKYDGRNFDGKDFPISDITSSHPEVVEVNKMQGGGYDLTAKKTGETTITITHDGFNEMVKKEIKLKVVEEKWYVDCLAQDDCDKLLPGSSVTFNADIRHFVYDSNKDSVVDGKKDYVLEWKLKNEQQSSVVTLTPLDNSVKIVADKNAGQQDVPVTLNVYEASNGKKTGELVESVEFVCYITNEFYTIKLTDFNANLGKGQTMTVIPSLMHHYIDKDNGPKEEEIANAEFNIRDSNNLDIRLESGKITITRPGSGDAGFGIEGKIKGDWKCDRWYELEWIEDDEPEKPEHDIYFLSSIPKENEDLGKGEDLSFEDKYINMSLKPDDEANCVYLAVPSTITEYQLKAYQLINSRAKYTEDDGDTRDRDKNALWCEEELKDSLDSTKTEKEIKIDGGLYSIYKINLKKYVGHGDVRVLVDKDKEITENDNHENINKKADSWIDLRFTLNITVEGDTQGVKRLYNAADAQRNLFNFESEYPDVNLQPSNKGTTGIYFNAMDVYCEGKNYKQGDYSELALELKDGYVLNNISFLIDGQKKAAGFKVVRHYDYAVYDKDGKMLNYRQIEECGWKGAHGNYGGTVIDGADAGQSKDQGFVMTEQVVLGKGAGSNTQSQASDFLKQQTSSTNPYSLKYLGALTEYLVFYEQYYGCEKPIEIIFDVQKLPTASEVGKRLKTLTVKFASYRKATKVDINMWFHPKVLQDYALTGKDGLNEKLQKEYHDNYSVEKVFEITATEDGKDVSKLDQYITITIPKSMFKGNPKHYKVMNIDDNGNMVEMETTYEINGEYIVFKTGHLSKYAIITDEDLSGGNTSGGGSSGGYVPTTPGTAAVDKAKADAEKTITAAGTTSKYDQEEQQAVDQIIEKAKADLKNAKTEEEVKAITEAAQKEIEAVLTAEEKAKIKAIENVGGNGADGKAKFIAKSKLTKVKGRKAVRISWNEPTGIQLDGYKVYRSTKKNKFGSKPYFTTDKTTYTNTKDLKKGKTYYYKVRGYKEINGEIVYTGWSTNAYRTMK